MKNNIDNFIKSANASLHCYRPIDGHVLHSTLALGQLKQVRPQEEFAEKLVNLSPGLT